MDIKKRILIIEDNAEALEDIKENIILLEDRYDFEFSLSGEDALTQVEKGKFDIVVCDQVMPDVDGVTVLSQVRDSFPDTIRILMAEHLAKSDLLKSSGPIHQYLTKPFRYQEFERTLNRVVTLRELIVDQGLQDIIGKMESLPSIPSLYFQVEEEMNAPDPNLKKISEIISLDLGMSSKVLQLVNSAFFGLPRRVDNISLAASLLGLDILSDLILMMSVFSQFDDLEHEDFSFDYLTEHSVNTAKAARAIAQTEKLSAAEQKVAYTAGLMHDIGKLVFLVNLPEKFALALQLSHEENIPLYQAEMDIFQASHQSVGAYLLDLWGFPDCIVEAVAFHHDPEKLVDDRLNPTIAIHVSNYFEHMLNPDRKELKANESKSDLLNIEYLKNAGLGKKVRKWLEIYKIIIRYSVFEK